MFTFTKTKLPGVTMNLSDFGRKFLCLPLRINKLDKGYVDYYVGPEKLRKIIGKESIKSPNTLLNDCKALEKKLFKQGYYKKRERYLEKI